MRLSGLIRVASAGVTAALVLTAGAAAQETSSSTPVDAPFTGATGPSGVEATAAQANARRAPKAAKPATIKLYSKSIRHGRLEVASKAEVTGKLKPYVPGQRVQVSLIRGGKAITKANAKVRGVNHGQNGEFHFHTPKLIEPGKYKIRAHHALSNGQKAAIEQTHSFKITYPDIDGGDSGSDVKLFNKLLTKQGFYGANGSKMDHEAELAVLAFRKVNGMDRTFQPNPKIFKILANGKGTFKLKYPDAGKHVEADLSKQVLVLANKGKPQAIFHISSGKPSTPTVLGHYHFYSKTPGYNSEGMYYSSYFIRGYATHGYDPVPTYNASHGCLRNPIPFSKFIYDWISIGDSIYVYN